MSLPSFAISTFMKSKRYQFLLDLERFLLWLLKSFSKLQLWLWFLGWLIRNFSSQSPTLPSNEFIRQFHVQLLRSFNTQWTFLFFNLHSRNIFDILYFIGLEYLVLSPFNYLSKCSLASSFIFSVFEVSCSFSTLFVSTYSPTGPGDSSSEVSILATLNSRSWYIQILLQVFW